MVMIIIWLHALYYTHLDYHFQPVEGERRAVVHAVLVCRHKLHSPVAGVRAYATLESVGQEGVDTAGVLALLVEQQVASNDERQSNTIPGAEAYFGPGAELLITFFLVGSIIESYYRAVYGGIECYSC